MTRVLPPARNVPPDFMFESYYRLHTNPFRLTPDLGMFYPGENHQGALARLCAWALSGVGLAVITGPSGTGKSVLMDALLRSISGSAVRATKIVTTRLEPLDFMMMIAAGFRLPNGVGNEPALRETVRQFLEARSGEGRRTLLVVDEAQGLPPESLHELLRLSEPAPDVPSTVQIALAGQDRLWRSIKSPEFERLINAVQRLHPLSATETREYIEHRLTLAGWAGNPRFMPDAYEVIYAVTGGIPRAVNMFCGRLMLWGFRQKCARIDGKLALSVAYGLRDEGFDLRSDLPVRMEKHATLINGEYLNGSDAEALAETSRQSRETQTRNNWFHMRERWRTRSRNGVKLQS